MEKHDAEFSWFLTIEAANIRSRFPDHVLPVKPLPLENKMVKRPWMSVLIPRFRALTDRDFDCDRELLKSHPVFIVRQSKNPHCVSPPYLGSNDTFLRTKRVALGAFRPCGSSSVE